MRRLRILLLLALVVCAACSKATPITIVNRSAHTLRDVEVSGSGFVQSVGAIPPRSESRVFVRPQGESGLRVSFSTDDRKVVSGPDGYFEETGYAVTATVSPELFVLVDVQQRY